MRQNETISKMRKWLAVLPSLLVSPALAGSMTLMGAGQPPGGAAWTPANLTNMTFWLDVSTSSAVAQSSGNISQICDPRDTAGACSRINAVQASTPLMPALQAAAQNGLDTAFFNGAVAGTAMSFSSSITGTGIYSCWAVIKVPASGSNAYLPAYSGGSAPYPFYVNGGAFYLSNTNGFASSSTAWSDYTNYHVVTTTSDGTAAGTAFQAWVDNAAQSVTGYTSGARAGTWDNFGKGGSPYADIYIGEMFCSSVVESSTTLANGRAYLKAKWGTP